jgi:hypothetical protein
METPTNTATTSSVTGIANHSASPPKIAGKARMDSPLNAIPRATEMMNEYDGRMTDWK